MTSPPDLSWPKPHPQSAALTSPLCCNSRHVVLFTYSMCDVWSVSMCWESEAPLKPEPTFQHDSVTGMVEGRAGCAGHKPITDQFQQWLRSFRWSFTSLWLVDEKYIIATVVVVVLVLEHNVTVQWKLELCPKSMLIPYSMYYLLIIIIVCCFNS